MLLELVEMGFDTVELGHGIRMPLMPGILKVVESGKVRISSLHNFCPLPVEITRPSPDCFQFSSHKDGERARAVRQTLQTIDYAGKLGADRVVLHAGRVVMPPVTRQLIALAKEGQHLSPEYARMKFEAVRQREAASERYLERVRECLKPVLAYAGERGIRLGIESRHSYEEIPSEREFPAFLDALEEMQPGVAGYWHDIGHTQVKANLGFHDHEEVLARMAPRLIGCHLHDVTWPGGDHQAPFTGGTVAYDKLIPLLPENCLFVWEMNPKQSREAIVKSLETWRGRFGV